jgi:hypothetical protein
MSSVVGICNNALIKIGEDTITALTDNTKEARLCNQIYESTRDAVIRAHIWNFAIKRVELAENTTAPTFEYENAFDLPSDCLRVLNMEDSDKQTTIVFKIEGRQLVTDESTAKIRYIARIVDPNTFDDLFKEALSARLAFELAYPLSESNSLAQTMYQVYLDKLSEARTMDGQEGTPDQIVSREWTDARI